MSINVCNDRSMASITSLPSGVSGSSLVLLSTQTASNSSSITFTSDIDSTYKEYIFKCINIQSGDESGDFAFQVDTGTNTNYNQSITSTFFDAYHTEADDANELRYLGGSRDQANQTALQALSVLSSGGSDECENGTLHLFDPSNTTFVKHFISRSNTNVSSDKSEDNYVAGYCNVTAAIDGVQFKMDGGNIDAGTIKLYGIKDS